MSDTTKKTGNTVNSLGDQAAGGAQFVTSTLGNTLGGVTGTLGNVTGEAMRGVGNTVTSATGETGRPVGDALGNLGTGVQGGLNSVGQGVENAGQWDSGRSSNVAALMVPEESNSARMYDM